MSNSALRSLALLALKPKLYKMKLICQHENFYYKTQKQVYAAYANRGLTDEQMKDDEIRWDADKIDTDVFERTFLKSNTHIQVDLPFNIISNKI